MSQHGTAVSRFLLSSLGVRLKKAVPFLFLVVLFGAMVGEPENDSTEYCTTELAWPEYRGACKDYIS